MKQCSDVTHNQFPNFDNHRVLLRADLNVPLSNGVIQDDFRLLSILPTINEIFDKHGIPVLITHLGRPHGIDANLSTRHLIPWFEKKGYTVIFAPTVQEAKNITARPKTIILLENIRFWPEEQHPTQAFAQQLATLADFYINDAFATLHRNDTSITMAPTFFEPHKRFLGPLIHKELCMLDKLLSNHQSPFLMIMGGGKIETKIKVIDHLIDKIDTFILTPALVFTFLKARGKSVGKSLIDMNMIPTTKLIMQKIESQSKQLLFPLDYQIASGGPQGPLSIIQGDDLSADAFGISIGPQSVAYFKQPILHAKTIFFNAAMGFLNRPETLESTYQLLTLISQSNAFSVVAGGESVACVRRLGLEKKISYLSTGGGASLAYLAGEPLPGLKPFKK